MSRFLRTSRILVWFFLVGLSLAIMMASSFYLYLRPGLPPVDQLLDIQLQTPLRVYSADHRLIAEFGEKRRAPVTIEQIPTIQLHAFLAAEDARFYEHIGVDFKGLLRAAIELVTTGSIQSGGSTITMQVAKNYFLSRDRTFIRKFNEILLALQIERELEKNQIFELYLNKIYLGNRAYGIESAARVYYDKSVSELSLAQMAMLATLPKAPSAYNPLANPERALIRRNWVLGRMQELGHITEDAYRLARAAPITASYYGPSTEVDADYVAEMARSEMVNRFGDATYTDGYKVMLTVDSESQQAATDALRKGLEEYDRRHGFRGPAGHIDEDILAGGDLGQALSRYPRVESLYPAVVTGVSATQATLFSPQLSDVVMPFETMTWARLYINENRMGPEPTQPADVLGRGDVVYVKPQAPAIEIAAPEPESPQPEFSDAGGEPAERKLTTGPTIVALAQIPEIQGALISLEAKTGAIQALSGGYSFGQTKYNRATQARRQPGSTFKPFLYLAALENGMTPATLFNDAPIVFDDLDLETTWRPQNSSGQFYGPTRLREALYRSRNLVSIRLLQDLGINTTINYLEQLRIPTSGMQKDLSLALGSGNLAPMDVARGFAVIANGGYDVEPYLIQEIRDDQDRVIYQAPRVVLCDENCEGLTTESTEEKGDEPEIRIEPRLAEERAVYIMHSMLRDVVRRGTGQRARALGREDIGGKTGTTNEQKDTWFAGFNHEVATTVWVGFDQPEPLGRSEYGATAALPVWLDYMKVALEGQPPAFMPQPNGIVSIRIDPETGERARPSQDDAIFELFREEEAPEPLSGSESSGEDNGGYDDLQRELF
ncbi:penicillin-binding protein 1A [Marinobacter sp.]|uniref:penicillin-binding protein 1A n=1 Tax=Marinobacter sp. TaxID=50741 RepID=UPI00384EA654